MSGSPWPPPPPEMTPTSGLPAINDPHPSSRWREILVVLGIIASIAVILVAVFPFINDDDEGEATGGSAGATTVPGGAGASVTSTIAIDTTLDTAVTAPAGSDTVPVAAGPLVVAAVEASCTADDSTDSRGNAVTFAASNVVDGNPQTAWRCPGDGVGQSLTFTLAAPSTVTSLGAIPGFATVDPFNGDDRFAENRRVVSASWSCIAPGGVQTATAIQTFADDRVMQTTPVNGFTGCAVVRVDITGSTPPTRRDFVAVSEVAIDGAVG